MRSPIRTAALAAAATLILIGCVPILLSGCVTSKQAWERAERIDQIHKNAPQRFVGAWKRYQTQAQGRYGILALDRKGNGVGWIYCADGCQGLLGNRNQSIKSQWALKAIVQCEDAARRHAPTVKPDCDIYAIKDEIVWKHAFPWTVGDKTFYDHRKRIDATQE
ncbi:MAG: hypothetical protein OXO52_12580 [Rhodospirillales bacterium]|nr:hypothetical protein [Rhodospirillales bacterium]MDE0380869.1 hypothetical protein [Rhodospirillales bacterium]